MAQIIDLGNFPENQQNSVKELALKLDPTVLFVVGLARLKRDPMLVLQSDLEHKEKIFVSIVGEEHSATLLSAYETIDRQVKDLDSEIQQITVIWENSVAILRNKKEKVKKDFDSLAVSLVERPLTLFDRPDNAAFPKNLSYTATAIKVDRFTMTKKRFNLIWTFIVNCHYNRINDQTTRDFSVGGHWTCAKVSGERLHIGCQSWPLWQVEMVAEELGLT
jgi:hypothetical protein